MQILHDYMFSHYGLDWAAGLFMVLSLWRLGSKQRDGFLHAAIASGFWIAFNVHVESGPGIVINAVILGLSVRSFVRWSAT